eukprot:7869828-Pyramimonas_sp.AAC.2
MGMNFATCAERIIAVAETAAIIKRALASDEWGQVGHGELASPLQSFVLRLPGWHLHMQRVWPQGGPLLQRQDLPRLARRAPCHHQQHQQESIHHLRHVAQPDAGFLDGGGLDLQQLPQGVQVLASCSVCPRLADTLLELLVGGGELGPAHLEDLLSILCEAFGVGFACFLLGNFSLPLGPTQG